MIECALCRRSVPVAEDHHLVPENRAESPVVQVCTPCHKQVHALFTNEELREKYATVTALRNADRLQSYYRWIRDTDKLDIDVRTARHVRDQRQDD